MHTDSYPQLIPLVILIPAIGAFINIFWGKRLTERVSGWVGITAALLSFVISWFIVSHVHAAHGVGSVVNPPAIFDGWIRIQSIGLDIPWQFRVDPLTSVMLLVVTGVGSLIHIYSMGYMHGDPKFSRFFAYLNMFLMFMLILVTGNNFLMLFVGWEGVGLCSYLLIGFWWDKGGALGHKNANAARKAMIVNRVGDFGILMAIFLIFWTFGTLNFYSPGETANVCYAREVNHLGECATEEGEHGAEGAAAAGTEGETSDETAATTEGETTEATTAEGEGEHEETTTAEGEHSEETAAEDEHGETTAAAAGEHGEADAGGDHSEEGGEGGHGEEEHEPVVLEDIDNSRFELKQLGVFGQTDYYMSLPEGDAARMIDFGAFELEFGQVIFLILIFMLLGVAGKSAQIPLFVWLPDAMAGPTPVSALIHAATMVTAGVFLLVRSNVFLDHAPEARFIIAVVGAVTALMAGYIATGQWDIKRVLAYSTISQLGFMVAAVGLGAYVAALFHLATHAVFKALLFLGSGSVIHGVEHGHHIAHGHHNGHDSHGHDDHHDDHAAHDDFDPQDMRNMGGLGSRMPLTYVTYLFGTFALAGLPFFAGFWSKDEILADAWHEAFQGHTTLDNLTGYIVLGLLLLAAAFTAFYMWRQVQMVFHGQPRSEGAANAPESSAWMVVPLMILAFFSFTIGFVNVPTNGPFHGFFGWKDYEFKHFVEASIPSVTAKTPLEFNWLLAIGAVVLAFGAIALAHSRYAGDKSLENREDPDVANRRDPLYANRATRRIWSLANARLYWDEIYGAVIEQPYNRLADFFANVVDWRFLHDYFHDTVIKRGYDTFGTLLARPFDLGIIDGIVNGVGRVVSFFSGRMRGLQTGYVRTYAVVLLFGVVLVIVLTLLPLIQAQAGQ